MQLIPVSRLVVRVFVVAGAGPRAQSTMSRYTANSSSSSYTAASSSSSYTAQSCASMVYPSALGVSSSLGVGSTLSVRDPYPVGYR